MISADPVWLFSFLDIGRKIPDKLYVFPNLIKYAFWNHPLIQRISSPQNIQYSKWFTYTLWPKWVWPYIINEDIVYLEWVFFRSVESTVLITSHAFRSIASTFDWLIDWF